MSFAIALASAALAQAPGDFVIDPDILLEANSDGDGYMVNGVGAPTVMWDQFRSRYVMFFETRLPDTDPECTVGMWGLGMATSTDGVNWTPNATALLKPVAGTYYSCVAAHPSGFQLLNDTIMIYFKAEQASDACAISEPSWGCARFTGIGRLQVYFNAAGGVRKTTAYATPILKIAVDNGFPKVTLKVDTYYMFHAQRPNVWLATSKKLHGFTLKSAATLLPGFVSWGPDEAFSPSVVCEVDDGLPLTVYPGGKDLVGVPPLISAASWGRGVSADGLSVLMDADPYFTWNDDLQWRHWEVLRLGATGEHLLYYSEKDPGTGNPRIRMASTTPTWSGPDLDVKRCFD